MVSPWVFEEIKKKEEEVRRKESERQIQIHIDEPVFVPRKKEDKKSEIIIIEL